MEVSSRVVRATVRAATLAEAEVLGIDTGQPVVDLRRVRFIDGSPLSVDQSCLESARVPGLEDVDFTGVPVDLDGIDDFRLAIYDAARKLGYGQTTTYGELAKRAGQPGLPRETGAALGANPVPLVIPCHRILAAGGKIGGFSAPGGSVTKEKMLAMEGVRVGPPPPAQVSFGF